MILAPTRKIAELRTRSCSRPGRRTISTPHGARERFSGCGRTRRRSATRSHSSPTPPLSGARTNSTSTWAASSHRPAHAGGRCAEGPDGQWVRIGAVVPHTMFWGCAPGNGSFELEPFRLAAGALGGKTKSWGDLTIAVAGVRVESDDDFLILASDAKPPGARRPVGSADLLYSCRLAGRCLAG